MNERPLQLKHDGLSLSATVYGREQDPLVILLHGFPDTPYSWDKLLPQLVAAGYRVLTPWLRGYTHGSARRDARYDLLSVAADIEAWRQELLVDQAHLVGHDWGAAVANVLSGLQGARAPRWLSISMLAVPPMPAAGQWKALLPQLPRQLGYSAYMPLMQLSASHRLLSRNNADYVLRLWRKWSPGWAFDEADFAPARLVFSDPQLAWASTRYYRNLFRWHDSRVRQAFRAMAQPFVMPTLALAGQQDGCMHPRTHALIARGAAARGPLQAQQLPACGHFLQAEQPDQVGALLLAHFQQAEAAAAQRG